MELSLKDVKELLVGGDSHYEKKCGKTIVVLQRGWVMVGDLFLTGTECRLDNAKVIRVWGTNKGLGEIALAGPTGNTKLDDVGSVTFHRLTTICEIKCNEEKWR